MQKKPTKGKGRASPVEQDLTPEEEQFLKERYHNELCRQTNIILCLALDRLEARIEESKKRLQEQEIDPNTATPVLVKKLEPENEESTQDSAKEAEQTNEKK